MKIDTRKHISYCTLLIIGVCVAFFLGMLHGSQKAWDEAIADNIKRFVGTYPAVEAGDIDYLKTFWYSILSTHVRTYRDRNKKAEDATMDKALENAEQIIDDLRQHVYKVTTSDAVKSVDKP